MADTRSPDVRQAENALASARGRDLLNEIIRAQGVMAIVQSPYGRVSYGRTIYGSSSVNVAAATGGERGTMLWIDRDPHPFEGTRRVRISVGDAFDENGVAKPSARAKVEAFVERLAILQRRDEAVRLSGDDVGSPGAAHYRVHALVARLCDHVGVRREELCDLDRYPHGGRNTKDTSYGKEVRTIYRHDENKRALVQVTAEARGDRIVVTEGSFGMADTVPFRIAERASDLTLQLFRLSLPDTVVTTLRGRMLGDVVKHPAIEGLDLRIISARKEDGVILKLPVSLVPLAA